MNHLDIRPIYHRLEHRVESHIFLSIVAYTLLMAIEKTLREGCHDRWATVRETLRTHQICTVVLPTTSRAVLEIRRDARAPAPRDLQAPGYACSDHAAQADLAGSLM